MPFQQWQSKDERGSDTPPSDETPPEGETSDDKGEQKTGDEDNSAKDEANSASQAALQDAISQINQLKDELNKVKSDAKDIKSKYSDIDPEAAREALTKQKEAERKKLEDRGEYEKVLEQVRAQYDKELSDVKSQLEETTSTATQRTADLERQVRELTVGNAFATSEYIRENTVLTNRKAQVLYNDHFDVEDGKVVPYDKPKGAPDRVKLVDKSGSPMSFEAAIETIIKSDEEFDSIAKAKMTPGTKSTTEDAKSTPPAKTISSVDRISQGLKQFN